MHFSWLLCYLVFASHWMWYFTSTTDILWRALECEKLKSMTLVLVYVQTNRTKVSVLNWKADLDRSSEYNESHHFCLWTIKHPFSIAENDTGMTLHFYLWRLLGRMMRRNLIKESTISVPFTHTYYLVGQFSTLRNQVSYVLVCAFETFNFLKCATQTIA